MSRTTLSHLTKMKTQHEKIAMLTVYDASFARLLSKAGVDVMLIGDSLGTALGGYGSTIPVTMEHMIYHTQSVCRASPNPFIVVDLPFMSYANIDKALENATCLMQAGAEMVKLEGGKWLTPTVAQLSEKGIPVCAHLGLTPQHVHKLGGYKVQGRNAEQAQEIIDAAHAHQQAGAQMLVLECVPWKLGKHISETLLIPVIGIGAGPYCDGQVLVTYDMLGITDGKPFTFVKDFMHGETTGISGAISAYIDAVKSNRFPGLAEHSFA